MGARDGKVVQSGVAPSPGISPAGGGPDNAIARWDSTTLLQGSTWILDDVGNVVVPDNVGLSNATAQRFVFATNAVELDGGAGNGRLAIHDSGALIMGLFSVAANQVNMGSAFGAYTRVGTWLWDATTSITTRINGKTQMVLTDGQLDIGSAAQAVNIGIRDSTLAFNMGFVSVSGNGANIGLAFAGHTQIGFLTLQATSQLIFRTSGALTSMQTMQTGSGTFHQQPIQHAAGGGVTWDAQLLAADKTLASTTEAQFQFLDCGGANRNVNVPNPVAAGLGLWYTIENTSDAGAELLQCRTVAAANIAQLRPGGQVTVLQNGTDPYRAIGRGIAAFGGLRVNTNAVWQVVPAANAYLLVNQWTAVGGTPQDVAESIAAETLTATPAGIYRVGFALTLLTGTTPNPVEFTVFLNGVATTITASHTDITGGLPLGLVATDLIFVPAGGVLDVRFRSISAGSAVIAQDGTFTIEKVN